MQRLEVSGAVRPRRQSVKGLTCCNSAMSRFRFQLDTLYIRNVRYSVALETLNAIGGYSTAFKHVELPFSPVSIICQLRNLKYSRTLKSNYQKFFFLICCSLV